MSLHRLSRTNSLITRLPIVAVAVAALAFGLVPGPADAQSYPSKPIRLIASAAAGATTDMVSRLIAEKLSVSLGQPVIVENVGGAGGTIATGMVAKAPPDGHTFVVVALGHATSVHMYSKLPYDPIKDVIPVSHLASLHMALSVPSSSPVNSYGEFLAYAKSKKGQLNYASSGQGTSNQLAMELLKAQAGFEATHVPYRGLAPATIALVGAQVDASFLSLIDAQGHARTGKLKILATAGAKRSPLLPHVPTIAESGLPAFEVTSWLALLAPAGTPKYIVDRVSQEVAKVMKQPDVVQRLAQFDVEPVGSTPAEIDRLIKAEIAKWGPIVKRMGIKSE